VHFLSIKVHGHVRSMILDFSDEKKLKKYTQKENDLL
jgi:hypothetical protein